MCIRDSAYTAAPDVLVEECIVGTEVTCGCVILPDDAFALPVTEVVAHDTFFDYDAKYYGKSDEITPARISPEPVSYTHLDVYKRQL